MHSETQLKTSNDKCRFLLSTRWCIYIDILGFSRFWECKQSKALASIRALMLAIYRIGIKVYSDNPERLFVHQMGDGFAIVSEFGERSLERPIAIAIALMRHVATTETFAAATIAEGDHADIIGCYPREVTSDSDNGVIMLGAGLMTLSSVMGTAFIRAYRLHNAAPSGPLLTVLGKHRSRIPDDFCIQKTVSRDDEPLCSIDWIRSQSPLLSDIQMNAEICNPSADALTKTIRDYCTQNTSIRDKWGCQLRNLLGIDV